MSNLSNREQKPVVSTRPQNPVVNTRPQEPVVSQQTTEMVDNKSNSNLFGIALISVLVIAVIGIVIYKKVIKK